MNQDQTKLWILGAGGHAKEVIETLRSSGGLEPSGVLDDDSAKWGGEVLGVPICGPIDLEYVRTHPIKEAVIAIGSNKLRAQVSDRFDGLLKWVTIVHPSAVLAKSVQIGEGTVIFAGVVVQPDVRIGRQTILNTGCTISHDGVIGDFAHIAPGGRLAGNVLIGDGAFLGIGSSVIPGVSIGRWTTVGAGSVVVKSLPSRVVAYGAPARVIRWNS